MDAWVLSVAVSALALATGGAGLRWARRRRSMTDTELALAVAVNVAMQRQHAQVTVAHVALALLADPAVAARAAVAGVDLAEVQSGLEQRLASEPSDAVDGAAPALAPNLPHLLSAYRTHAAVPLSPVQLMTAILDWRRDQALAAAFDRAGLTTATWKGPHRASAEPSHASKLGSVGLGPYRSGGENADTEVVFWNDEKTPMGIVQRILGAHFAVFEPAATRTTLEVHGRGYAVVGTYPRSEAERRIALATRTAREGGWPLRVTACARGTTARMSRVERWLRARTTLLEPTMRHPSS